MRLRPHNIPRYERYARYKMLWNANAKTPRDKKTTPTNVLSGIHCIRSGCRFLIPPRNRGRQSTALSFGLKTVHRTVFFTPSQFSKRWLHTAYRRCEQHRPYAREFPLRKILRRTVYLIYKSSATAGLFVFRRGRPLVVRLLFGGRAMHAPTAGRFYL